MSDRRSLSLKLAALAWLGAATAAHPALAAPEEVSLTGYVAARGVSVRSQPSWLDRRFGRLSVGAEAPGETEELALGKLHVAVDYEPTSAFGVYVHGVVRAEPEVAEGDAAGVVEAYVHGSFGLRRGDVLRYQLGHFILPTSRENVEFAWSSPYTITFSALNAWIGEDVRPTGLLAEYSLALGSIDELRFGAGAFGGNDASGALLAWRGWTLGDRLTTFGETVPLPPIRSLRPGGDFEAQLDSGTQPFGSDLDSRLGWAGYVSFVRPTLATFQWTRYENRGDRGLHNDDEYAWTTEFDLFGAEVHPGPSWSFAAEYLTGSTGMGLSPAPYVQLDVEAAYVLASCQPGAFRLTLRYDEFETVDRDSSDTDVNDEDGQAWTLALFWEPDAKLRLGVELVDLDAERPEAAASGFDSDTDARSVTLELRYYFDW